MDFRFFRSPPEPQANVQFPGGYLDDPGFTVIALERTNDPDSLNQTGYDYYGAYGDGELIDEWSETQPLELADILDLPRPLTYEPEVFFP
jgi:hypothetical protein